MFIAQVMDSGTQKRNLIWFYLPWTIPTYCWRFSLKEVLGLLHKNKSRGFWRCQRRDWDLMRRNCKYTLSINSQCTSLSSHVNCVISTETQSTTRMFSLESYSLPYLACVAECRPVWTHTARGDWVFPTERAREHVRTMHADCNFSQSCPDTTLNCFYVQIQRQPTHSWIPLTRHTTVFSWEPEI